MSSSPSRKLKALDSRLKSLEMAFVTHSVSCLETYLLSNPGVVYRHFEKGFTILHYAAIAEFVEALPIIAREGAFLSAKNCFGDAGIHIFARLHHIEGVRKLVEVGGDPLLRASSGASIVHIAAMGVRDGRYEFLRELNDSNDWERVTSFIRGALELDSCLLEAVDERGRTPVFDALRFACSYGGGMKVLNCLLEHGANLQALDNDGNSVLHEWADSSGRKEVLDVVLRYGASALVRNRTGKLPLDIYAEQHQEVEKSVLRGLSP